MTSTTHFGLHGRSVVIIGGAKGIGEACARRFVRDGAAVTALGPVHGLVSNAGIFRAAGFLEITEADWDAVIGVNLKGSFLVGQAVARGVAAAGRGAIVNMSSVNGSLAIASIAS